MSKVIFMKGISSAGKSTYAKTLEQEYQATLISMDSIREEENFDKDSKKDLGKKNSFSRAFEKLNNNENVIIDGCNIGKPSVMKDLVLKTKSKSYLYWIITHPDIWANRATERVSKNQIYTSMEDALMVRRKMYEGLTFTKMDDFHEVKYIINDREVSYVSDFIEFYNENKSLFINNVEMFINKGMEIGLIQKAFPELMQIMGYDQGNIHHTLTLDKHTFKVCENLPKTEVWAWAGLLHDLGKVVEGIREYNPEKNNHTYRGHAGASTDIGICVLNRFGFNFDFIEEVMLIVNRHMYLPYEGTLSKKKIKALGYDLYEKLVLFREADMSAK